MKLPDLAKLMREHGVKRVVINDQLGYLEEIVEMELFEAPAVPPSPADIWGPLADTMVSPAEHRELNTCIALGCAEKNGWQGDSRYCRAHGLAAAGVRAQ